MNDEYIASIMIKVDDVESRRPYLGETLWLRFFIYRAFVGRLGFIVSQGREKRHIEDWRNDKGMRQILSGVLPSKTLDPLLNNKSLGSLKIVFGQLESIILEEISLIVSGRRSASESFENAKELHESVSKCTISKANESRIQRASS